MFSSRTLVLLPAAIAVMFLTGCFESNTVQCAGGVVCPEGFACTADGLGCTASVCGNEIVDPDNDEQCDDGNQNDEDLCKTNCQFNVCGDGIVDRQDTSEVETCDTSGESATCDDDCSPVVCGDDNLNENSGEICDAGDTENDDGCRFDCLSNESCGNGVVDDHLALSARDDPSQCAGDATTPRPGCREACDTMNPDGTPNPMCSPNCLSERVCGDFIRDNSIGEVCDDGNTDSGDTCSSDCRLAGAGCGNGVVDGDVGEECDTGLGLDGTGNPIDNAGCIDCKISFCGDNRTNPLDMSTAGATGEQCDPGDVGLNTPTCDSDCTFPMCNDEIYNPVATMAEACDATADVGAVGGFSSTCDNNCTAPVCGDNLENNPAGEECDPGAIGVNTMACNSDCSDASCGDRFLNPVRGETCDDGDPLTGAARSTVSCDIDCTAPVCGDAVTNTQSGEQCDPGTVGLNTPACDRNCTTPACGDNILNRTFVVPTTTVVEACDDGNTTSGDGCSNLCQIETCGDGITQTTNGEVCDDGNTNDLDACRNSCSPHVCGDSVDSLAEVCDTGGNSDTCDSDCTLPVCGDGLLNLPDGEECDDGDTTNGDGCNSVCDIEPFSLSVTRAGTGVGSVASGSAGINCGTDCNEVYAPGTMVVLSASAGTNSVFLGWSGVTCPGTGTCTVTMDASKGVVATFELNQLTVLKNGNGTGTVTGTGIACGLDCGEPYTMNTMVTLTATPDSNNTFTGWAGACTGMGPCTVTMTGARTVTATFTQSQHLLTVARNGNGTGTVTSAPAGINCGLDCMENYDFTTSVTLTATPDFNNAFAGWAGEGCTGTGPCVVSMSAARNVTATFTLNIHQVSVVKIGTGTGTVTSIPAGINCGTDCVEPYNAGAMVQLTAAADAGSTFGGWSGGGCSGTSPCTVTVTAATAVTATFTINTLTLLVNRTGTGTGTVTSVPSGINCGSDCTEGYSFGTLVTLTASAGANSTFTGWSGACTGLSSCVVTMTMAQTVTANFDTDVRLLTVAKGGTGTGTVTSTPAGISCGLTCAFAFAQGSSVTLNHAASTDSIFTGWSGDCTGTGPCVVSMNTTRNVTANFALNTYTLTVSLLGAGTGTVNSTPSGIGCPGDCNQSYTHGQLVTLVAVPTAGTSVFTGWGGAAGCSTSTTCVVTVTAASTVTATFALDTHVLSVAKAGTGTGTVTSSPAGISCGGDCSEPYPHNQVVQLTAAASGDSTFTGWTGATGCTTATVCNVTVAAAMTVTATFTLQQHTLTVLLTGTGAGTVNSVPMGIGCPGDCMEPYNSGSVIGLVATPSTGSTFTGWSGGGCTGTGICFVTLTAATTVQATFTLQSFAFNVVKNGAGTGTVASTTPAGTINCGGDCSENYTFGTAVVLTATPTDSTHVFAGWSGACTGTGTCNVTVSQAHTATATFNRVSHVLTVTKDGTGDGTVTSNPSGLSACGTSPCTGSFTHGTVVVLTAVAASNNTFTGWTGGGCAGTGTCVVTMTAAASVTATFTLDTFDVTVVKAGTGDGLVTSDPSGISCGLTCVAAFGFGAVIELTADPDPSDTFVGWTGACVGTGPTCQFTLGAANATVTATFDD